MFLQINEPIFQKINQLNIFETLFLKLDLNRNNIHAKTTILSY
jgi:hypothetical protein